MEAEAAMAAAAAARSDRANRLADAGPQAVVTPTLSVEGSSAPLRGSFSVWDDPEEHLFGATPFSRQTAPPGESPLLTPMSEAESVELFAAPAQTGRLDAAASSEAPEPEPQLQSPALDAVNMRALVRLAWMWQETGHGTDTVWVRRLVTLDASGSVCIFASDKASRPDITVRREECNVRRPRTRRVDHPHAFRVDSLEHRTDGVYNYKLVLSPCENPEEETASWIDSLSIDRSRCDDDEADMRRKAELWKKDSERKHCAGCTASFSVLKRRHHCRLCGDIFCDPCCEIRRNMPEYGYSTAQRVCVQCAQQQEKEAFIQTQLLTGGRLLGCGSFDAAKEAFTIGSESIDDSTDERLMQFAAALQAAASAQVLQDESRAFVVAKREESDRLYNERDYGGAVAALDEALSHRNLLNNPAEIAQLEEQLNTAVAAKLAEEKALCAATAALTRGMRLLETNQKVEEGVDVLSSEYIWQDYSGAIEAFRAGLAEETGDASLTQQLQQALKEAEAEAAHVTARQKLRQGEKLLEKKNFAGCLREFEAGIAIEAEAQSGGSHQQTLLAVKLREKLTLAELEHRRCRALECARTADERLRQSDYVLAVEKLTAAISFDIEDPALSETFENKLIEAQSEAVSAVQDKIASSERMLKISAWDDARDVLSAAIGLLPALAQTASAQQLGEDLRDALAYAEASNDFEQAEEHMRAKQFDSAATASKHGLDRNQQRDQTLNNRLQNSLDAALAAKLEQDTARERAKAFLHEGQALGSDDDTLESAIVAFEAGLALRSAVNGGLGYTLGMPNSMETCMRQLEEGLAECKKLVVSRDAARKEAKERLVEGSRLMNSRSPRMSTVIRCFEDGLQQKQHKNDPELNAQLKTALEEATLRASDANTRALEVFARGTKLMSTREFEAAIEEFQAGLGLRLEVAGVSSIMDQLAQGIGDAEREIAMRETRRKNAERLLEEGTRLVVSKDFDGAVDCFDNGLLEQTDDEELTYELQASLAIAKEAINDRLRVREEIKQLEGNADRMFEQREWCSAVDAYREALLVAETAGDPRLKCQIQRKLESTLASQKSAQEAAQRYLTAGKKLCVGGDKFAEAKIAFEQGLAEKPSDPELVRSLTAALAQFSSTSDDSVEGDEEKEENNPVEELARANRSRLES